MSAKPLYGSRTAVTITLDSLSNGALADSSEYNNTSLLYLGKWIEVNATGSNAAEAGYLEIYAREGLVTGVLNGDSNLRRIGSVKLNGTTAVRKILYYDRPAPFYKIVAKQASSSTYALASSGNSMYYLGENIQDI